MKSFFAQVVNPVGLHARPASVIVQAASRFQSAIAIDKEGRRADAKSILSVLSLGAGQGCRLRFDITGADEEEALSRLKDVVVSNLGPIEMAGREDRSL